MQAAGTALPDGWMQQYCEAMTGHVVYQAPERYGAGDTTVGKCLRCTAAPVNGVCDDAFPAEEIHIRNVCESTTGNTWAGVGGAYADHKCVPTVVNTPPDDCSFRDQASCEAKPACTYIPSSGGVNPNEPGSTVLFEMNASAREPVFRQPMEPGFVDLFVMPAPSIARLEPKTGPFEGNTTITVVGDHMVKSSKVSCQFDYSAGVAFPGDAGTTVMYGGDLIVDWTRDGQLWSRDLIGLNGTDETNGAFSDYSVICSSPRRDDWLSLPPSGFYSKLNVTQDMIDFRVGILAQEWSEPLDFQFYRQPIIKRVEPRHGPLSGNTTVTFHGHYFYDTHTITCSFGDRRGIVGTFDNITNTVTCISPNQTHTGSVPVEIALNGQQYTENGVQFTYYEPAWAVTVADISPKSGPTTGVTTVVVSGNEYLETNETKCMFGDLVVDASFRPGTGGQPGQLVCVSAPCCYDDTTGIHVAGTVNFEIALNGQQYTTSGLGAVNFRFYEPPTVTSISPLYGNFNENIDTTVDGTQIVETNEITCRFGAEGNNNMVVSGSKLSMLNAVACETPVAALAGPVFVTVSLNGQQYTSTSATYSYTPVLRAILPARGLISGDTNITIAGMGFRQAPGEMFCKFAHGPDAVGNPSLGAGWSEVVPVTRFLSQSIVYCSSPSLNISATTFKLFQVELSVDGGNYYSTTSLSNTLIFPGCSVCTNPSDQPADPPLCCASDTQPVPPSTQTYYYEPPQVVSVAPFTGSVRGNTDVVITGLNFVQSNAPGMLQCKFVSSTGFGLVVPAVFIDDEHMSCLSPDVVSSGGPQDVTIEITMNDQQYTDDGIKFTYYDPDQPPVVTDLIPGSGSKQGHTILRIIGSNFKHPSANDPPLKCRFGSRKVDGSDGLVTMPGLQPFSDSYLSASVATWISSHAVECETPPLGAQDLGTVPKTVEVANEPFGYTSGEQPPVLYPTGSLPPCDPQGNIPDSYPTPGAGVVRCEWEYENWILNTAYANGITIGAVDYPPSPYVYSANSIVFLYSSTSAGYCRAQGDLLDRGYVGAGSSAIFQVQAYNEQNDQQTTGNDIFYVNGDYYGETGVYNTVGVLVDFEFLLQSHGIVVCDIGEACVMDCPDQTCPNCPSTCVSAGPGQEKCRACLQPDAAKAPIIDLVIELATLHEQIGGASALPDQVWPEVEAAIPYVDCTRQPGELIEDVCPKVLSLGAPPPRASIATLRTALTQLSTNLPAASVKSTLGPLPVAAAAFRGSVLDLDDISLPPERRQGGSYEANFTAFASGVYQLHVMTANENIGSSPFEIVVRYSIPDASQWTAAGPGLRGVVAAEVRRFYIQMRDRYRNPIDCVGSPDMIAECDPLANVKMGELPAEGTYNGHQAEYNTGVCVGLACTHRLQIDIVMADGYQVDLRNLNTGNEIKYIDSTVETASNFGCSLLPRVYDPRRLVNAMQVSGPCGVFQVMYSTLKAGVYAIHVGVRQDAAGADTVWIKDSPFRLEVAPEGSTDTVSSTAYGPGLHQAFAGEVAHFYVQAKDQHGNDRLVPEEIITTSLNIQRDESFRVVISFAALDANGVRQATENAVPDIVQATPAVGDTPWVDDACPNLALGEQGIDFGHSNVITNCDLQNSTYAIAYVATVAGLYDVQITRESAAGVEYIAKTEPTVDATNGVDQLQANGNYGFILVVLPAPTNVTKTTTDLVDASQVGLGDAAASARAGEPHNFTVQSRDRYANRRISGGDTVRANSWYMGEKRRQLCSQRESSTVCWAPGYQSISMYSCTQAPHAYTWVTSTSTCYRDSDMQETAPEDWILYTWQTDDYVSLNQARIPIADENTGVYQIQYLTNRSGFYNIDVYMVPILSDGTMSGDVLVIPESPFTIQVDPAPASAERSFVFGDGLGDGIVIENTGELRSFTIVGVDQFGNERLRSGLNSVGGAYAEDPFRSTMTITPDPLDTFYPAGTVIPAVNTVVDSPRADGTPDGGFGGGKYLVTFSPQIAGTYDIKVYLETEDGTQLQIRGGRCLENCYVMTQDDLGAYVFMFLEGARIRVGLPDDQILESSPFQSVWKPATILASQCVASATPGEPAENNGLVEVVAGEQAKFTVTARDRWGNDRTVGGDHFNVQLRSRDMHMNPTTLMVNNIFIEGQITDRRKINATTGQYILSMAGTSGKYDTEYIATLSGIYDLYVSLGAVVVTAQPIADSPFAPQIMSASTSGPDCSVEQIPAYTMAGSNAQFRIVARDRFGNKREGFDSGQPAEGHRFSVDLVPLREADQQATIVLAYYDRVAAAASETGGILRDCTYEPPGVTHLVCDRGDGKYVARYQPTVAGTYNVTLMYQNTFGIFEEFKVSPRTTRVTPADLTQNGHVNSWAFGEGLTDGISRKPALFTIQARDRFNNNATSGGAVFTVFITGKEYIYDCSSEERLAYNRACTEVVDRQNGYYDVTWYPTWVGDYKIQVQLKISASEEYGISGSKYDSHVDPDKTHAATSSPCGVMVTGTANCLTDAEVASLAGGIAGAEVAFTIQARDEANNPQPSPGGDRFNVTLFHLTQPYILRLDPCIPELLPSGQKSWVVTRFNQIVVLDDCVDCVCDRTETLLGQSTTGTGQYVARYTTTVAGNYMMRISLTQLANGMDINDPIGNMTSQASPYSVYISPAAYNGGKTIAYGEGTATAIAGSAAHLKIQPKDLYGNNGTYQRTASFSVKVLETKCRAPDPPPDAANDFVCRCGGLQRSPSDPYCRCCELDGAILDPIQAPIGDYFDAGQKTIRETIAGGPSTNEQEPDIGSPDQYGDDFRFSVQYSLTIAGSYRLRIALAGSVEVIIQDSTLFEVTVLPAPASADRTRIMSVVSWPDYVAGTLTPTEIISGETISTDPSGGVSAITTILGNPLDPADGVPAGSAAYFTMFVYDEFDNLRNAGGDQVEAELRALAGDSVTAELIIVDCNVTDHLSGQYTVAFVAERSADYDVMTTLSSQYLRDPPFKARVVAAERNAAQCVADGPGLVGGQHARQLAFTIIAKDRFGNQIDQVTNDTFSVEMNGIRDSSVGYGASDLPIDISTLDEALTPLTWADILGTSVTNEGLDATPNYGQYTASYTAPDLSTPRSAGGAGYTMPDGTTGDFSTLGPFISSPGCSTNDNCEGSNNCCVVQPTVGPWDYTLSILVPGEDQSFLQNMRPGDGPGIDSVAEILPWALYQDSSQVTVGSSMGSGANERDSILELEGGPSGKSHMWQTFKTVPGERYRLSWDVFMNSDASNSAMNPNCQQQYGDYMAENTRCVNAGDQESASCGCWGNGGLDILDAWQCQGSYGPAVDVNSGACTEDVSTLEVAVVAVCQDGAGVAVDSVTDMASCVAPNTWTNRQVACETLVDHTWTNSAGSNTACWEQHSTFVFVEPTEDQLRKIQVNGEWQTLSATFVAPSTLTTARLHFSGLRLYVDNIVLDTHITGSPFPVTVIASFQRSVATGVSGRLGTTAAGNGLSGSTAGRPATFKITPRDPLGLRQDPTTIDWMKDFFNVTLDGIRITETAPQRNSIDDRYTVEYNLPLTGVYELSIILDTWGSAQHGYHIENSPFSLTVVSSAAVPVETQATGPGLVSTVAGEVASFVIQTRDEFGNIETDLPVVGIGDRVIASATHKMVDSLLVPVSIQRVANATVRYDATYTATFSGTYDVTVTLNGHIVGSGVPIEVFVTPAATHAPSCVFEGAGVLGSTAGMPGVVQLYAKDRFGNLVPDEANDFFLRLFCYSGRCSTSYDASTPVDITDTDPDRCALNPCTDRFQTYSDMGLDDSMAGFYQGEYYVEVAGQYQLKVDLGGLFVGTPTSVLVTINPTGFSSTNSIAEGEGLIEGKAGTPALFVITAKDVYDNQLTEGGLVFSVQVRGPSFVLGAVTDGNDGTYQVTYEPRVRGNYKIQVRSRGLQIPCRTVANYQCHSEETLVPGTLLVEQTFSGDWLFMCTPAATFADRSFAYGQGLTYGVADANIFQEFTVQALDKFGVTQENGGELDSFRVDIKKSVNYPDKFACEDIAGFDWNVARLQCYELVQNFTLAPEADQLDGTYFVRYQVQLAGDFMMHVLFNNNTVENDAVCNLDGFNPYPCGYYDILASPFPLIVEAGPIFESRCTAVDFDLLLVMAGEATDFIVQTKDEFGNNGKYDVYGVDRGIWGQMVPCVMADADLTDGCETNSVGASHGCCPMTDAEIAATTGTPAQVAKVSLTVRNMLDGRYRATLWARYSTTYLMTVKVGGATTGVEIDGSPYFKEVLPGVSSVAHLQVTMSPDSTDPNTGLAVVGDAVAGDVLTLSARTRDAHGNWLVAGGESISIEMRTTIGTGLSRTSVTTIFNFDSHNGTRAIIVDHGDGTYTCDFALTIAGTYTSTVKLGTEVADERPLVVGPAAGTDAGSCTAEGPGWNGAFWNNPASFSVQARDLYGNPRSMAGDIFKMEFAEVVALNNSGAVVLTTVLTGSASSIDIGYSSGLHVKALFGVDMGIRTDGQDASTSATGFSTRGQYVGERLIPYDFRTQAEDLILDINGVLQQFEVKVNVRHAGDLIALIQPLVADSIEMTPEYGIEFKLPSKMSTDSIRGINNESQPLRGGYYGPGLHRLDYFGHELDRNVEQQAFAIFVYRCVDSTDACERKINISGSPRLVTVATAEPDPSPTTSVMVGDLGGTAGADTVITLQTRNPFGINEVTGGANVTFVVNWEVAPPVPEIDESLIEAVDNGVGAHVAQDDGDGSYSLRTNKFTVAAYYILSVLLTYDGGTTVWDDQPIAGSPFRVLITPSTLDLAKTYAGPAESTGISGGRIDPLNPATFTIFPQDRYGNAYLPSVEYSEAERGFEVSLTGPDLDDGTPYVVTGVLTELCVDTTTMAQASGYACTAPAGSVSDFTIDVLYSVTLSGAYSLSITFERGIPATPDNHGRIEDGLPKIVRFDPGVPTAEHSFVSGRAINGGPAGTTHNFTVSAMDAFGNIVDWAARRRMQAGTTAVQSSHTPVVYTVPASISTGFEVVRLEETDISQILERTPTVTRATTVTTTTVSIVTPTMVRGQISNATVTAKGDGTFKIGYSLFVAGTYNVSILVGNSHVVGSPYAATITAAALFTPDCVAIGPGLDTARAGKEASFVIYAKDAYGNALTVGGNTFAVTLEGPVFLRADVGDNNDGTYMVQYQPMTSGSYNIAITRSEADATGAPQAIHVKDSPFAMSVQPGKTFAGSCDASGPGLSEAVAGLTRGFIIQAKDQLGATLMTGGDTFVVELASAALSIPGTVYDNSDGTYSVAYRVTNSGQYTISVLMGVENIDGSPFALDVVPAQISAEKCVAAGDGLAGMTAGDFLGGKFLITAHDHYGNRRRKGGDHFTILVQGLENGYAMTGDVTDNDDGTYAVSYLVTVIGAYDVQVLEGLAGINDIGRGLGQVSSFAVTGYLDSASPFQAQVIPAATDFERTLVDNIPGRMDPRCVGTCPTVSPTGSTLCAASGCVYTPDATDDITRGGSFRITANDRFGNKKDSSDAELSSIPFKAVLSTMYTPTCNSFSGVDCSERLVPHRVIADITAVPQDGTFIAKFASTLAGEYKIAVTYAIGSVEGYPVLVQSNTFVRPGDLSVEHSYPFGPGLRGGLINQNVSLGIQCVDEFGNLIYRRMTGSADTFRVTISQSSSDTRYDSVANPTRVAVKANDSPNTRDYTHIAGYGSVCGEDRRCSFGPGETRCTVCGTYTVKLNVAAVDTWKLTANRQGISLATAPPMSMLSGFTIRFVDNLGTISYQDSQAYVTNGIVGQVNSFKIQAKTQSSAGRDDALEVPTGGYQVKVEIVPLRKLVEQVAPATVDATPTSEMCLGDVAPNEYRWTTDNGRVDGNYNFITDSNTMDNNDGTVTVTWTSPEVGEHRIVVLMVDDGNPMGQGYDFGMENSECVSSMPRVINVTTAAISATETRAFGPGLQLGDAGTELTFTIETRDRFGNVRSFNPDQSDTEEAFSVILTPFPETPDSASRTIQGITEDSGNGQFMGAYMSTVAGVYHVSVAYGSTQISGSPYTTTVAAGEVHTPSCKASGAGLVSTQAGDISTYNVAANDQFGNLNSPAINEMFIANFNYNPDQTTTNVDPVVVSSIAHGSNGNYIGTYNATVSGQYTLEILRQGPQGVAAIDTAGGSAYYSLVVHPGTTAAERCLASGLGLSGGTAGDLQNFLLTAADRFGNRVLLGGDVFTVEAVLTSRTDGYAVNPGQAERKRGTVHDNADGTYDVEYRAILDGTFRLDVKLDDVSTAGAPFNDVILNMAQPPEMLSCIFAENGGSVVVAFDGATNRAGMQARGPCDAVLDPVLTLPLLGSGPECFWSQPDRLVIFLGNSFQLDLGVGKIRLRGYSLRSLANNSEYAIGEMSPDFPANPPVPQIQVRAPSSIGVCEDVQLDASGTTGTGGRPVYFQWGVQIGPSNASLIQQNLNEGEFHDYTKLTGNCQYQETTDGQFNIDTKFNIPCTACENQFGEARPMTLDECKVDCATRSACRGFLYRASGGGHCVPKSVTCQSPQTFTSITDYFYYELADAQVQIPFNYLAKDESYTFVLQVQNWMGESSTWSGAVFKQSVAIPALTMLTGGSQAYPMEFASSGAVDLAASILVPVCISSAKFNYQWSIVSGPTSPALDSRTQTKLALHIPKLTLMPGHDYTLRLHAELDGFPLQANTATAYVRVVYSDLAALIGGGDRTVAAAQPLEVSAIESYDPDETAVPFSYRWTCAPVDSTATGCFTHLPLEGAVSQAVMSHILFDTTRPVLIIPAGALQADASYVLQHNF